MIHEIISSITSKSFIEILLIFFVDFSRETAGEEDHSTYNLGVLKKPVYALTDEEIIANGGRGGGGGLHNIGKCLFTSIFLFIHFHLQRLY